jgi:hypothetical protein
MLEPQMVPTLSSKKQTSKIGREDDSMSWFLIRRSKSFSRRRCRMWWSMWSTPSAKPNLGKHQRVGSLDVTGAICRMFTVRTVIICVVYMLEPTGHKWWNTISRHPSLANLRHAEAGHWNFHQTSDVDLGDQIHISGGQFLTDWLFKLCSCEFKSNLLLVKKPLRAGKKPSGAPPCCNSG